MVTRRIFLATGLATSLATSLATHLGNRLARALAPALRIAAQQPASSPTGSARAAHPSYESVTGPNSLRAHAQAHGLLIGTAVDTGLLRTDPRYRKLIPEQFNLIVAENAMKWAPLRPTPQSYNFTDADALVAFAQAHGLKVRGHNFCWHDQLPAWFAATVTKQNAEKFLVDHIHTVGRRYAGKMHSWDVVNEAQDARSKEPDLLRAYAPWFQLLGPSYIEIAFKAAREADPQALLTLNDYGIEYESDAPKRNAVLALLRRLKAANVPVDAVGIQSHLSADSANRIGSGVRGFVEEARALGLQVFITEMDVNDDPIPSDDPDARDAIVAETYRTYVRAMASEPGVKAITTWGFTDRATWLNGTRPHLAQHPNRRERALPFDDKDQPTPAFFAMREGIDARG